MVLINGVKYPLMNLPRVDEADQRCEVPFDKPFDSWWYWSTVWSTVWWTSQWFMILINGVNYPSINLPRVDEADQRCEVLFNKPFDSWWYWSTVGNYRLMNLSMVDEADQQCEVPFNNPVKRMSWETACNRKDSWEKCVLLRNMTEMINIHANTYKKDEWILTLARYCMSMRIVIWCVWKTPAWIHMNQLASMKHAWYCGKKRNSRNKENFRAITCM